jgi:hypothetical protein
MGNGSGVIIAERYGAHRMTRGRCGSLCLQRCSLPIKLVAGKCLVS